MLALVGYECDVEIKWIDANSTREFENIAGGYINTSTFDYDLKFVANRVEIRTTAEYLENNPLVMWPAKRINFIDAEATIETPILTPIGTSSSNIAEFMYNVLTVDSDNIFTGKWAFIVRFSGVFNNRNFSIIGLFILNNCTINITDTSTSSVISGNMLIGAVGASGTL
jgi:hypothetical protein